MKVFGLLIERNAWFLDRRSTSSAGLHLPLIWPMRCRWRTCWAGGKGPFNILNIGRFKLGALRGRARNGAGRDRLRQGQSIRQAIAEFGLIQEKLESAAGIYAGEAMIHRTIGMIDAALADVDECGGSLKIQAHRYAVECSILKVWASEMLDMVVDHVVQIFAGYGYVEEYPAERAYRDSRINRIFEGTNEINRLIITGWLMKRAMAGQLPLLPAIKKLMDEVMAGPSPVEEREGPLSAEYHLLANAKKLALFAAGAASQKYMTGLADEQEVMGALADCIMEVFALESCILRAEKLIAARGEGAAKQAIAMTRYYAAKAVQTVELSARKRVPFARSAEPRDPRALVV